MEFWLGLLIAVLCIAAAVVCTLMIRKKRQWIIGTILFAITAIVFVLYSILTAVLFEI